MTDILLFHHALVADSSFGDYDPVIAGQILQRTLPFLDALDRV